jgi:hypothetical protein
MIRNALLKTSQIQRKCQRNDLSVNGGEGLALVDEAHSGAGIWTQMLNPYLSASLCWGKLLRSA